MRRDTYPSIPRWICFSKILNDGVTFRDSIGWFVISDRQRTQRYWPQCFKCKFFDSEISWNLSNSILSLHEILIRDTLCFLHWICSLAEAKRSVYLKNFLGPIEIESIIKFVISQQLRFYRRFCYRRFFLKSRIYRRFFMENRR